MIKYSATEIIGIGVFICFCIGIMSILCGIMMITLSLFLFNGVLEILGISLIFYGLAVVFVSAGIGCFLKPQDRMLIL